MEELGLKFVAVDAISSIAEKIGATIHALAEKTKAESMTMGAAWSKVGEMAKLAVAGYVAAGVAIAGFAVKAISAAGDYQSATSLLLTSANETRANIELVRQGMLQMAGEVGISALKLADAMPIVDRANIHGADSLKVLKAAAEGAKDENADVAVVVNAVTSAMTDYHYTADQAAMVTTKLVAGVSVGKTTFQEYTGSLHSVLPVASASHIALSEILGDISSMTAHGYSAEQAAQNLAHAIQHLQTVTTPQAKELALLGLSVRDLQHDLADPSVGLSGALEKISTAIRDRMGPDGQVVLQLQTALSKLPPEVQKLGAAAIDGTMSMGDYSKAAKGLSVEAAGQANAFATLMKATHGIGMDQKSGGQIMQAYAAALKAATGDSTSLNVALMLTGENAAYTSNAIGTINKASVEAGNNVKGWGEIQSRFNQVVDRTKAGFEAWTIQVGTRLLPVAGAMLTWLGAELPTLQKWGDVFLAQLIPAVKTFASGIGALLPTLGLLVGVYLAMLPPLLTIVGAVAMLVGKIPGLPAIVLALAAAFTAWSIGLAISNTQLAINVALAGGPGLAAFLIRVVAVTVAMGPLNAATALWNVLLDANPVGLVVVAIAALVAIIVVLVTHWRQVVDVLGQVWSGMHRGADAVSGFIAAHRALAVALALLYGPLGILIGLTSLLITHWQQVPSALNVVWGGVHRVADAISGLIGAHRELATALMLLGGPVTIVVGLTSLLITHWRQVKDTVDAVAFAFSSAWSLIAAGADPLASIAGSLGTLSGHLGATKTQVQEIQKTVEYAGGLRLAPSAAAAQAGAVAKERLPVDQAVATMFDKGIVTAKAQSATPAQMGKLETQDKAAHARVAADQSAIEKAKTPLQHVGDFFSGLGGAVHGAITEIGKFFSWLGSTAQSVVGAMGGFFSGLGKVTHGVVDAIGGFFSGVGRVAHDIASAVGGFFSKIGADLHRDLDIVRVVFVTVFAIWLGMWIAIGKVLLKPVLDEFHRLVPVVGAIMSAVGTTMRAAWDFVSGMVGAAASAIGTTARRAWDAISEAVGGAMSAIGATVHAAWNDIAAFFGPIFSAIGTTFHEAWSALSAWIGSIMSAIGTTIHNAWNAVAEFVGPIMSQIGAAVHDGWNNVWNTVTTWTGRIRDVAQGVWDAMVRAAESAGTGIWNGIKSGLNSAIGVLNSFIDNSNDFLGHFGVPKVSHIPKLAAGGVVDRPTLAMIGEGGGPEVVIPTEISKRQRGMDLWRQAGEMMGIRGMGAGAGAPSMTPGDWGGQCVQLVETVTGHHFDVMAAAEMCKYVNSSIAKAGEIFVSTLGQFGHTGFVLGGGKVLDSNWALDERIQIHNLSDIPDICGYIDGIPASLAAVSGISLKAKVDEWIGGLEKTFGTDWTGQMERGLLNIAGNAIKSILPFDTGGTLPTGISTVFNGTGRGEPVLGSRAEDHLAAIRQSMGGRPQEIHTHVHLGNEEFCTLVQHIEDRRLGQLMSAT